MILVIKHLYDYRPNWTSLSPVTIANGMYCLFSNTCVEGPIIRGGGGGYKKQFTVIGKISNPYSNFILFHTNSEYE